MDTLLNYANKVNSVVQSVDGATEPSVERVARTSANRDQIQSFSNCQLRVEY